MITLNFNLNRVLRPNILKIATYIMVAQVCKSIKATRYKMNTFDNL